MSATVHTLKVTLRDVSPTVSRLVEVPSDMTLDKLSEFLERAMGWYGIHLHTFTARKVTYWTPPMLDDGDVPFEDDSQYTVADLLWRSRMKMVWQYDLGDCWDHDIVVQGVAPVDPDATLPCCVGGEGACPPEDCGGPWGYAELKAALRQADHPRREEAIKLLGEDFDASHFDPVEHFAMWDKNDRVLAALEAGEPFPAAWIE